MQDVRDELVQVCRWRRLHGYNDADSGNLSALVGDTVWPTPAGTCG